MIVAIILDNIYLVGVDPRIKKIMLFEANNELVTAVDEDTISMDNINYLCLWLLGRRAERLYGNGISEAGREFLQKAGIEVFPLEAIRDHPILRALMLKEDHENS